MRTATLMALWVCLSIAAPSRVHCQRSQAGSPGRSMAVAMVLGIGGITLPLVGAVVAEQYHSDGTAAGLVLGSLILGPAPGLTYAGNGSEGAKGILIRTGLLALAGGGAAIVGNNIGFSGGDDGGAAMGALLVLGAAGGIAASWIMDLRDIPPSVRRINAPTVSPTVTAGGGLGFRVEIPW